MNQPIRQTRLDGETVLGVDVLWEILVREGVEVVFGYPGGAIMPAYDALPRYPIHHVLVRHEQGASHMADGYARASGRVGVCIATSGPGATNLVTGLATAMMDSVPMVAITGQVPSHAMGSDAFQETDILGITLPITKHGFQVTRAEDLAAVLREAFALARHGRPGPVIVDITKDAQIASLKLSDPGPHRIERTKIEVPGYSDHDLDRAAALIGEAKRPLLLVGHGVTMSGAHAELQALVDRTDIPLTTTLLGLGAHPTTDPHNLGMMGMHGESWVNEAIQKSDLLIAVGMRFDDRVTGNLKTYAQNAKKIHIELDPAEIGKVVVTEVGLCGDAKSVLRRLTPRLAERNCVAWRAEVASLRDADLSRDVLVQNRAPGLIAPQVIRDLWELTEGKATIVSDVGQHQMWEAQYYQHDRPGSLLTSGGLGTMGFALPAAIGARFAKPDEEIWVIVGDGGFQMTAAELSTCSQEGIKINVAIINNSFLGMVRQWQEFFFQRNYVQTTMHNPDFVMLAQAHGLAARRVDRREDIADAVAFARAQPGTTVIEFRVLNEENVFPMVPAGKDLADMIRRPRPEDT